MLDFSAAARGRQKTTAGVTRSCSLEPVDDMVLKSAGP